MCLTRKSFLPNMPLLAAGLLFSSLAFGGAQIQSPLSASVRAVLQHSIADQASANSGFSSVQKERIWMRTMSHRMSKYMPDRNTRLDFLKTVHYEAARAGLDPQMVLGLIEVESRFRKYAVSKAGARGYMQVMPFWVKDIGTQGQDLFHLRTNLRYGCTILRYYLDMEHGNLFRALGRYNGSLGRPGYPLRVKNAWLNHWNLPHQQDMKTASAD